MMPTQRKSGHGTASQQETDLWRTVMSHLYGPDWRSLLEDAELQRAIEAQDKAAREQAEKDAAVRKSREEGPTAPVAAAEEGPVTRSLFSPRIGGARGPTRRAEDVRSDASSGAPSPRTLRRMLHEPYDPSKGTLVRRETPTFVRRSRLVG